MAQRNLSLMTGWIFPRPVPRARVILLVAVTMGFCAAQARGGTPRLGVGPFPVGGKSTSTAGALAVLTGLGSSIARTRAIRWEELEPRRMPGTLGRYDWSKLDASVRLLQLGGFEPLVVLSCRSSWACQATANTAWAIRCTGELSRGEATAALVETRASGRPPRKNHWKRWEVFIQHLVERYDADGKHDMPGLRRAIVGVQVQESPGRIDDWIGSVSDYLRLLHHTDLGAHEAHTAALVVTGAIDVMQTGQAPHPLMHEWKQRVREVLPTAPKSAVFASQRAFDLIERLLDMPRLYDVISQRGSGNLHNDFANVRFLRRSLDAKREYSRQVWLVDTGRNLKRATIRGKPKPSEEELRIRRRWLPPATNPGHSEHARAKSWLRLGQAYDVVRTFCTARLAGADAILGYAPFDEVLDARGRPVPDARFLGLVDAKDMDVAATASRTPRWYALRQLGELLRDHRSVAEANKGLPGRTVLFHFGPRADHSFVAVLFRDPSRTWAGEPGRGGRPPKAKQHFAAMPLPNGTYFVEAMRTSAKPPAKKRVKVEDGILELSMGPAPVYVYPVPIRSMRKRRTK